MIPIWVNSVGPIISREVVRNWLFLQFSRHARHKRQSTFRTMLILSIIYSEVNWLQSNKQWYLKDLLLLIEHIPTFQGFHTYVLSYTLTELCPKKCTITFLSWHSNSLNSSEVRRCVEKCILACNVVWSWFHMLYVWLADYPLVCLFTFPYLVIWFGLKFCDIYLFTCFCPIVLFIACNFVSWTIL